MSRMARRVQAFGNNVFSEMTGLAMQYNAVNLGQGFPDFAAPDFAKSAAQNAIAADINQYAPPRGRPRLRAALQQKYAHHYGLDIDPNTQIAVTCGASEALFAAIMGLADPGDEIILFEPYFDIYLAAARFAGAIPKYYVMQPPDWQIDRERLEVLFSAEKTKLIIVNTPHNPTGTMFSRADLELIAELCIKYDVIALSDEVYEHIVFDGNEHVSLASLPGMADRTVITSSMAKTFSITGWKTGWAIGPADLIEAVIRGHENITFCSVSPMQEAAADILNWADESGYYTKFAQAYSERRTFMLNMLHKANIPTLPTLGAFYIMGDISQHPFANNDRDFCYKLTKEIGVTAIPASAFFADPTQGDHLVRFAFCKDKSTLTEAASRLAKLPT